MAEPSDGNAAAPGVRRVQDGRPAAGSV